MTAYQKLRFYLLERRELYWQIAIACNAVKDKTGWVAAKATAEEVETILKEMDQLHEAGWM